MLTPPNGNLEVHQFQMADLGPVYQLEELCFKDPYPWWLLTELGRKNPDTFIVATLGHKIVGYAVIDQWDEPEGHYHLVSIAVHPEARQKGIAETMLHELESKLEPERTLKLEVRESNIAAISFYNKHNFMKTGSIPGYYADGETAIIMEKKTSGI